MATAFLPEGQYPKPTRSTKSVRVSERNLRRQYTVMALGSMTVLEIRALVRGEERRIWERVYGLSVARCRSEANFRTNIIYYLLTIKFFRTHDFSRLCRLWAQ